MFPASVTKYREVKETAEELNMESNDLSDQDVEEAIRLLNQVPSQIDELIGIIDMIDKRIDREELNFQNGLSILDLKNINMLDYLANLIYIMLKKGSGDRICGDPAIKRLVGLRVTMEKMRPIEEKIKYEVDKLISSTSMENIDSNDPLRFRANPDDFDVQDDNDEDDDDEEEKSKKVYVPPKITPAFFNEDTLLERRKKALESAKKKAISNTIMEELRSEFDTGPEEIKEMRDPYKFKISQELKERERFEEEHMMRLPMTKQQRHEIRQLTTISNFNSKFDDLSAVEMTPSAMPQRKSSSKKGKPKYRGKKRGSKRKR